MCRCDRSGGCIERTGCGGIVWGVNERITLRLSASDAGHLDALRGDMPRGPFLRSLLRDATAARESSVAPSSEQLHLERLRVITTSGYSRRNIVPPARPPV
jgi:hypothetical protein